jgi:eukaryotic-like serine/threonine-protein kinase
MNRMPSREEVLFTGALALPEADRAAFLDAACDGDAAMRARVAALLAAHAGPASLLMPQPLQPQASHEPGPGDTIGRYKLLQRIGEGGCGIVYMAVQAEPVRRRVALKIIKAGMDTRDVVARFEAERQALAMMDHPSIAKVLDGGETATGRPYFVMELVHGIPITHYCDRQNLSTPERLGLFMEVCHAVQHAHQKGIIHRDLKPSNILVTVHDNGPVPKVIDFGIAKATQGRLIDDTLFTAVDQFMGTPVYMSPEQAEMSGLDIDTRSDVYSLGMLLYELLTGRPPFDPGSLGHGGRDEIRRIIREVDLPRPSKQFRTLGAAEQVGVSKLRGTDPARLSMLLCGDLDWIVMKALEKDRVRRYQTANAMAADIARHLHDEAVTARPPSTGYRLCKLIRRNRLTFAAVAVVAIALLTGTFVSTRQALRATRAEQVAAVERSNALDVRARADALLAFMIGDLRRRLATVGRLDVLEAVGQQAITYFTSLQPDEINATTIAGHASALTLIGDVRVDEARYAEALACYREAFARVVALAPTHPAEGEALFARAQAEFGIGNIYWKRRDFAGAGEWFRRYRDTARALVAIEPGNLLWQRELASAYNNLAAVALKRGEIALAREGFLGRLTTVNALIEALPANLELKFQAANTVSFLGAIAERSGELAEALRRHAEEVGRYEEILSLDPRTPRWRFKLAEGLSFYADVLAATGQPGAARESLARARPLFEAAVALDPANVRWHMGLHIQHLKEALLTAAAGDPEEALQRVESTRHALDELSAREPTDHRIAFRLAMAWRLAAQLRHACGRPDAAAAAARACELGRNIIRNDADMALEIGEFAQAAIVAGRIAAEEGDSAGARRHWAEAREVLALAGETRHWRVLDPAARVAALLGLAAEARSLTAQLEQQDYVPLEPWPVSTPIVLSEPQISHPNQGKVP